VGGETNERLLRRRFSVSRYLLRDKDGGQRVSSDRTREFFPFLLLCLDGGRSQDRDPSKKINFICQIATSYSSISIIFKDFTNKKYLLSAYFFCGIASG